MNFITGISLITAFAGGMVALFAPCCITFLLPSYLANIFRGKKNILGLTLLFGLGIATVLVPAAVGIRAVGQVFQQFHTQTYLIGGTFMIILGLMELTGKKITIPMVNLTIDLNTHKSPWAVYVLGVFSGITSSCCTPVLAGILTLSFLSPSFLWAGLAGVAYVAGMVVPLVILALLLDRVDWQKMMKIKGKTVMLLGKTRPLTDVIAGFLFITVGIIFSVLAVTGNITMGTQQPIEATLGAGTMNLVRSIRHIPGSEYLFATVLIVFIIFLIKKGSKS
jgi:cytochrome c biogenesis protein CcdA